MNRQEAIIDAACALLLCATFFVAFWYAAAMDVATTGM